MAFDQERYEQVQRDEWTRQRARETYAQHRDEARQRQIDQMRHRGRYVLYHGREGAFRTTVIKWTIAAAVLAGFSFFSSIAEDGLLGALGSASLGFLLVAGFGVVRAYHIINSVK